MKTSFKILSLMLCLSLPLTSQAEDQPSQENKEESKWDVNQPQGEFQNIKIDVSEGTWMNLDVSPDGQTLVFDLLGDIYTLPIAGGEARALTNSIAWDMQPKFSPDGKWIAFTSDRGGGDNLWMMKANGSEAKEITKEEFRLVNSPAWHPSGDYMIGRKHFTGTRSLGAGEIWMYHKTGGSGLQMVKKANDQKDIGEPAFSPDGKSIYYSQDTTPGDTFKYAQNSVKGIYSIKNLEIKTGKTKTILSGFGGAIRPSPSPDGKILAYIARDEMKTTLNLLDLKSGEKKQIYDQMDRDMQETWATHGVHPSIAWLPDNSALIFWANGKIKKLSISDNSITDIPFQVTATKKIQKALRYPQKINDKEFTNKMLRWVQVSPTGKQALFEAMGHLYVQALPTGKPRRLTQQKSHFEFYPRYSSDGRKVVYVSWDDQDLGTIRVVSSFGGSSQKITSDPGLYLAPSFSQDNKKIVFEKIKGGYLTSPLWSQDPGLYVIPAQGGKAKKITDKGFIPQFGPDGKRVYFSHYDSGNNEVLFLSVDQDGHEEKTHFKSKHAHHFQLSPSGKTLAWIEDFNLFVTPFVFQNSVSLSPNSKDLPVLKLSYNGAQNISWTADSKTISWNQGPLLSRYSLKNYEQKEEDIKSQTQTTTLKLNSKKPQHEKILVLKDAKIISMKGDEVFEKGTIIIQGKRIQAVGKTEDLQWPEKAEVIDASGKTIIPGLIDVHFHGSQGRYQIIPEQNWKMLSTLAFGVTTTHDPSNDTQEVFAASEMQKAGVILAPRIFSTGRILYGAKAAGVFAKINSFDDAKFHLQRLKTVGAFTVKSYNQPRRNQRQQVIQAARELGMMVVPEGASLLQHNLTMIVDGHTGIEHNLPVANVYDDIRQLWKTSETYYTPALNAAYGGLYGEKYWYQKEQVWKHPLLSKFIPKRFLVKAFRRTIAPDDHYHFIDAAKAAKNLLDNGVKVTMGSHGNREGLGSHWELWNYALGGMTSHEALHCATINSAKYIGLDQDLGSLEAGKLADLVILNKDPLKNIRNSDKIDKVMLGGVLYEAETLNQVFPQKKERGKMFFEE